jgi:hypothetical protein
MKRFTRRQLLGGFLLGALGLGGLYTYQNRYNKLIVSILQDRLSYLDLSEIDLDAFADDFADDRGTYGTRGRLLALTYPIFETADFLNPAEEETMRFEERVVSRFLLSTDFFWNNSDETRPVRYLAYNNPYRTGCANPLAQLEG